MTDKMETGTRDILAPSRSQQRRHALQAGEPAPFFDDRGPCDGCGKTKDRVIRRIGTSYGSQKVCDECFSANPT